MQRQAHETAQTNKAPIRFKKTSKTTSQADLTSTLDRIVSEGAIYLSEVAKTLGFHVVTAARWVNNGIIVDGKKVHLEAVKCGGTFITSRQAVLRFIAAQN